MTTQTTQSANIERAELWKFCDNLPEPINARPVVLPMLGRGLFLALDCDGRRLTLTEQGQPWHYSSIDEIIRELEDAPNVDLPGLAVDLSTYRRH
jgi:hypothetical protein